MMEEVDDLFDLLEDEPTEPEQQEEAEPVASLVEQPTKDDYSILPATPDKQDGEPPVIDVRGHVALAGAVLDEILSSWRSDRCEVQDAADFVKNELDKVVANNDRPSASMVEQYIKALEVKANTNQTAVKCVDSITKLLAATKQGGPSSQTNIAITGNNLDLIEVLKRPVSREDP